MTAHRLDAPDTLDDGSWQPDGRGVMRWVAAPGPNRGGRPRKGYTMHPAEARLMHQRYNAGERDEDVTRGHREYNRRWARARRAGIRNPQAGKGSERFRAVESGVRSGPESALTDRGLATVSTRPKGA